MRQETIDREVKEFEEILKYNQSMKHKKAVKMFRNALEAHEAMRKKLAKSKQTSMFGDNK